jgi:hypothetical protein
MATKLIVVLMSAALPLVLAGCVMSNSGQGQAAGTGSKVASGSSPIMIVDGEDVYSADLVAFPAIRNVLRAYIYRVSLAQEAKKRGVTVSEDKLNERIQNEKDSVTDNRHQTWQEYLDDMNYTEDEYVAEKRDEMLLDELIALDIDTSDEALREYYDANKEDTLKRYFKDFYMPESERDKVGFDDVKDYVRDLKVQKETFPVRTEKVRELINNASLKILCFDSKELNEHYEDLILNKVREQMNAKAEEAKQAAGGEQGAQGDHPASPAGAVAPPGE